MKRTAFQLAIAVAAATLLAGCEGGDPRLKDLAAGISKDSAIAVMDGQPTKSQAFLVNAQYIEGLYYARPGKSDSASLELKKMTPVVLVNGKVAGWGWPFWDSVASLNKLPLDSK